MVAEELGEFTSSLKEVMTYLKYAKDMDQLDKAVQNDERFRHLERQAVDVINVTTNSGLEYDKGKEEIDVCEAIRQMREASENKGRNEGMDILIELIQKLRNGESVEKLQESYDKNMIQKALLVK